MPKTKLPESPAFAEVSASALARLGMALADWSEKWFPDAFVFALIALIVVFLVGLSLGTPVRDLVKYFGDGFWSLIPFTMQMTIIIVGGYVVATSPPVYRLICRLARIPKTPRAAIAFAAFFSIATAMISWGFCLIFSGLLVREIVRTSAGSTTAPSEPHRTSAIAPCGRWGSRPPRLF